ncbi:MAG TPA: hypothetical protein VGO65_08490 [Pseudolysinimonas sp.]|jgi:hypothetical protein|nr:hypothetical protein [Pseudolysinimonas sp.]
MNPLERPLVVDWLTRFDRAAAHLPELRREALRAELRAHLHEAIDASAADGDVISALDELGDPVAIVAEEGAVATADTEPPRRARRLAKGTLAIIVIAGLLVVAVPLTFVVLQGTAPTAPNVVTSDPEGPARVTDGRAYEEYRAEIPKLPALPPGASWPDGVVAGLDAGSNGPGIIESGGGKVTARLTWLCAWEDEYVLAEARNDDARLVAALDQLDWWAGTDFWREADPGGAWDQNVLGRLRFGESGPLKRDLVQVCGSVGIGGVYATLPHP